MSAAQSGDYMPGDPALHVVGKREEKSARRHRDLPPAHYKKTAKTILADIKLRRQELEPVTLEYARLLKADEALKGI